MWMTSASRDIFSIHQVEIRQSYDLLRNIGLRVDSVHTFALLDKFV